MPLNSGVHKHRTRWFQLLLCKWVQETASPQLVTVNPATQAEAAAVGWTSRDTLVLALQCELMPPPQNAEPQSKQLPSQALG